MHAGIYTIEFLPILACGRPVVFLYMLLPFEAALLIPCSHSSSVPEIRSAECYVINPHHLSLIPHKDFIAAFKATVNDGLYWA